MGSIFAEIHTDYVDENGVIHMDGYTTADIDNEDSEEEEGRTIAYIIKGTAYWTNPEFQHDPFVKEVLAELLAENEVQYTLSEDAINGIVLNEKIEDDDLFEYKITHRESFIDELTRWIGEATRDKDLMKEDLKMLLSVPDEYILSSNSTNSYLYQGCEDFNDTCKELLELNDSIK
jgi:hypothetical protein